MSLDLLDRAPTVRLPATWPVALAPDVLASARTQVPFLVCDLATVRDRLAAFRAHLPGVRPHFAVKCHPADEILSTLIADGSGFEIASIAELAQLRGLGVDPRDVLYSNPVKPPAHIAAAHAAGLWRFCADGEGELRKLARHAPGAAVYIRLRVDDRHSAFPLSQKFGVDPAGAAALLRLARRLGLRPYGLTFHVGSQCTDATAWRRAIAASATVMDDLADDGITLEMLDLGGGYPAQYGPRAPGIDQIGATICEAVEMLLPYPVEVCAEPGRYLVAESGVLVTEIIGREVRDGRNWLYLDVGAYSGLMEAQQTGGRWPYPVWSSLPEHGTAPSASFTVTGPTCDSSDTIFSEVTLPAALDVGDRLFLGATGAYTLSYASSFNGFAPPTPVFVDATGPGA